MKNLIILLTICNVAIAKNFDTSHQSIERIDTPNGYKTVVYDKRYSVAVPVEYKVKRIEIEPELLIAVSNNKAVFSIREIAASNNFLFNPKDYGLDNFSRKELIAAIYDKNHTSNREINLTRNEIFKISTDVKVYKVDDFIFYREDRNADPKIRTLIVITNRVNNNVLNITFSVGDENLILNVIKSFKLVSTQ